MNTAEFRSRLRAFVVLGSFVSLSVHGQTFPPTGSTVGLETARAQKVLREIDDPDPIVRQHASLRLNSLSGEALDVVEAAAAQPDLGPERSRQLKRAVSILRPRALHEREARERLSWTIRTWTEAYEHSTHTSPAWDADVRHAIVLFLQLGPDPSRATVRARILAAEALSTVIDKGCDDPLIQVMLSLFDEAGRVAVHPPGKNNPTDPMALCMQEPLPPAMKLRLLTDYVNSTRVVDREVQDLPANLIAQVSPVDMPRGELEELAWQYYDAAHRRRSEVDVGEFVREFRNSDLSEGTVGPLQLDARHAIDTVLEVCPGLAFGMNTSFAAQEAQTLKDAAEDLQHAWNIDPHDARTATLMLGVKLYQLESDSGGQMECELWFKRATEIDPDNYDAFHLKMTYLAPQWHGTSREMIEFARDCLRGQNWRAGIPHIVLDVHKWLAAGSDDSNAYYADPWVWQDISDVCEGAVVNFPDNINRSIYAKYAGLCGRWSVAHSLFEQIGEKPAISVFGSEATFEYLRKKAARLAAATQPASGADGAAHAD